MRIDLINSLKFEFKVEFQDFEIKLNSYLELKFDYI
jgi:hypothetical protein